MLPFQILLQFIDPVFQIIRFRTYWLAGFTSAEGCFLIDTYKSKTKLKKSVQLRFKLTQHSRYEQLMKSLIEYFDCGNLYKDRECLIFIVRRF